MLLTVGDSVCWGQGLKEKHKFDFLFAEAKGAQFTRSAHSGAVIGTKQDTSQETEAGEVPVGWPSIWQQVQSFKHWQDVDLVLLNGGINDVSLTRILNPGVSKTQLSQLVDQFCRQGMTDLLIATAEMMVKPNARIAVVGYYPILSTQSRGSDEQHQALLEMHGIATSSIVAGDQFSLRNFIPAIVDNCLTFWHSSDLALKSAVDAANATLRRQAAVFAKLPFAEENAMWASHSLLWELTPLLLPEDEVAQERGQTCDRLYGDLVHIPQWTVCVRASAGHPNSEGAAAIATVLSKALQVA